MSDPTNPDPEGTRDPEADGGNGGGKRAYVKPTFRQEQVFETMALACGKIDNDSVAVPREPEEFVAGVGAIDSAPDGRAGSKNGRG